MAICRRCGNQMADTAAACPACGELRYQQPVQATPPQQPQYAAPQPQPQYPQQPYAAPAAAQQYAVPVTADEAKGFIGALFDLSFTSFITTKLIRVLFIICIIGAALEALAIIGYGFAVGSAVGLGAIIASPIVFFAIVIAARVYMELVIVIFRGAEHLTEIAKSVKR